MNPMSVESHELALTIINDGKGEFGSSYQERLATEKKHKLVKSRAWLNVAEKAARKYVGKFCENETKWWTVFSNADVLSCAGELAEYYSEHLKEINSGE